MPWDYTRSYYSLVTSARQLGPCPHRLYPANIVDRWVVPLIHHRASLACHEFLSKARSCCLLTYSHGMLSTIIIDNVSIEGALGSEQTEN